MTSLFRVRVCHVVSGDNWGGAETMILNLVSAQARRHDLDPVLIVLNEGQFAARARSIGVSVRLVDEQQKSIWKLIRAVEQEVGDLQPHILHTHRYKENLVNFLIAGWRRYHSVVTIHGYEPARRVVERCTIAVRDEVTFRLGRRIGTRFVAVTDDLRRLYRLPRGRCEIIPNGISIPDEERVRLRSRRPRTSRAPVIGWAGRMVPIKGLEILLEAVANLTADFQALSLVLLGDGPERRRLERLADMLGISARVRFMGFVEDPLPHLEGMDVFVLPSLHEGMPMALLEAMAAGLPVVAAAVGGIPGLVGASGAARLVSSTSPEVWCKEIREILQDHEGASAMAEQGRQLVKKRYAIETVADRYARLYSLFLGYAEAPTTVQSSGAGPLASPCPHAAASREKTHAPHN